MGEYSRNPLKTADSPNHGNHLNGLSTRPDPAFMALRVRQNRTLMRHDIPAAGQNPVIPGAERGQMIDWQAIIHSAVHKRLFTKGIKR